MRCPARKWADFFRREKKKTRPVTATVHTGYTPTICAHASRRVAWISRQKYLYISVWLLAGLFSLSSLSFLGSLRFFFLLKLYPLSFPSPTKWPVKVRVYIRKKVSKTIRKLLISFWNIWNFTPPTPEECRVLVKTRQNSQEKRKRKEKAIRNSKRRFNRDLEFVNRWWRIALGGKFESNKQLCP